MSSDDTVIWFSQERAGLDLHGKNFRKYMRYDTSGEIGVQVPSSGLKYVHQCNKL